MPHAAHIATVDPHTRSIPQSASLPGQCLDAQPGANTQKNACWQTQCLLRQEVSVREEETRARTYTHTHLSLSSWPPLPQSPTGLYLHMYETHALLIRGQAPDSCVNAHLWWPWGRGILRERVWVCEGAVEGDGYVWEGVCGRTSVHLNLCLSPCCIFECVHKPLCTSSCCVSEHFLGFTSQLIPFSQ